MGVGRALRLVLFLDVLLRGPTKVHVPGASTSSGVHRLAGSGAGLGGVRTLRRIGHVARATAAKGMLSSVSIYFRRTNGIRVRDLTYHASVIGNVDASNRFAIIGAIVGATTAERSRGGHAQTGGVSKYGVARGRANVSSPTTSGGNDLVAKKKKKAVRIGSRERQRRKGSLTTSGSPAATGSLPRVSE